VIIPEAMTDYLEIEPASCDGKINTIGRVYIEHKLDGHRALLHMCKNFDRAYLTSRRISKKTSLFAENGLNVPQIIEQAHKIILQENMYYTVLDGEILVPNHPFEAVQTVMGSHSNVSIEWQKNNQLAKYVVFDILFLNGKDVRNLPFNHRLELVEEFIKKFDGHFGHVWGAYVTNFEDIQKKFDEYTSQGGEGLILKDPVQRYGKGWKKLKFEDTYDVVITGFNWGEGKFRAMIGAVRFGIYLNGKLTEIGKCSGMLDGNVEWQCDDGIPKPNREGSYIMASTQEQPEGSRAWFTINREKLIGSVMEVMGKGLTKKGVIRHPQFGRLRHDKSAEQCGALQA